MMKEPNIENYKKEFPKYPPLVKDGRWIYGIWMIGNNYRNKNQYYGEYPPSYLKRVHSLFPDAKNVLHLFCGSVDKGLWENEVRFDLKKEVNPDVVGNAESLSSFFNQKFDLILADPPYTNEDANKYGNPMVNRNKVVKECTKILKVGGYLVWLDMVLPMYRKDTLKLIGTIGLIRSTNHRFRVVSIFQLIANPLTSASPTLAEPKELIKIKLNQAPFLQAGRN